MRKFLASVAIVFALAGTPQAQDYDKGVAAFFASDYTAAMNEFRPLAELGYAEAQSSLGVMYENGLGVPQDYKKAADWYLKAAEQGDAKAQLSLAVLYEDGLGVSEDYQEAVNWYLKAAEQGDAEAQFNLALLHEDGRGVPQDNVLAHMWLSIAMINGDEDEGGAKNRDSIATRMSQDAIEKAQAMARDCMASNYQNCGY